MCVALNESQISLLSRAVTIAITSSLTSIENQGMLVVSACSIASLITFGEKN